MKKYLLLSLAAMTTISFAAPFNPKTATPAQKVSYFLGYEVMNQTPPELELEAFIAGIRAAHAEEVLIYDEEELNAAYEEITKQQKQAVSNGADAKFLLENAKQSNVKTTASGLQYRVDKQGTGKRPNASSTVKVHYEGTLINGKVFDSSLERNEPIELPLDQVIAGWTEGLQLMKEGAEYTLFIPADLGYGSQKVGPIPPNSTLIFKIQLLQVK